MPLPALIYHPAVSAGLLPLAIAMAVCALPQGTADRRAAVGLLAGFLVSAWMAIGSGLFAFDSTAKLIWSAVPIFAIGLVFAQKTQWLRLLLALCAVALPAWLIAPVIAREGSAAIADYWYLPLFNLYLLFTFDRAIESQRARLAALLALAIAIGLCAVVGASILYGERTLSLAGGVGALALRHLLQRDPGTGNALALPLTLLLGTLAGISTVYASVPATTLILIAVVPWAVKLPMRRDFGPVTAFALTLGYGLLPGLIAIAFVWNVVGPVDF
jgi:hypothetical protein